jgi:hypothetical protein
MAQVRDGWCKAVQDRGYSPRFISSEQLVREPPKSGVLILPQCLALSDGELTVIKQMETAGVTVLMNEDTGVFDAHGSLRASAPFPQRGVAASEIAAYVKARMAATASKSNPVNVALPLSVQSSSDQGLRVYRHTLGSAQLVSVERGIAYAMSEALTQAGGNEAMEHSVEVTLNVPPGYCYDLRSGKMLGVKKVKFTLDPWRPTLLAILPQETADVLHVLTQSVN